MTEEQKDMWKQAPTKEEWVAFGMANMVNEDQTDDWNIELDGMRAKLRFVLDNLNSLDKRNDVKGVIESVYFNLGNLREPTKEK